jgi:hypothetical protein
MDIEEIKEEKAKAAQQILRILQEYEQKTGTKVSDFSLTRATVMGNEDLLYEVNLWTYI